MVLAQKETCHPSLDASIRHHESPRPFPHWYIVFLLFFISFCPSQVDGSVYPLMRLWGLCAIEPPVSALFNVDLHCQSEEYDTLSVLLFPKRNLVKIWATLFQNLQKIFTSLLCNSYIKTKKQKRNWISHLWCPRPPPTLFLIMKKRVKIGRKIDTATNVEFIFKGVIYKHYTKKKSEDSHRLELEVHYYPIWGFYWYKFTYNVLNEIRVTHKVDKRAWPPKLYQNTRTFFAKSKSSREITS